MTFYVKLISLASGRITTVECKPEKYLNATGLEYFDRKRWRHAYIQIPKEGIHSCYRQKYVVSVIETERLSVDSVVNFRKLYPDVAIKIVHKNDNLVLYEGYPHTCPTELGDCSITHTEYTGKSLILEVD